MTHEEWLRDLVSRVPVLCVDTERAQAAGDVEAARYARAIAEWLDEARIAMAEASECPSSTETAGWVATDPLGGVVPLGDRAA